MSTTASLLAALALVGAMTGAGLGGPDLGDYLTKKDGRQALKEPLTLREEQGGIAGNTGTTWTVEPTGQWRVERFRRIKGAEHLTPVRSGTLSPAQLETLAKALATQNLAGLPEQTGSEAKVNPRRITLKFGRKTATLRGIPPRRNLSIAENIRKAAPAKAHADSGVWERFAHLTQAVETHCQAAGK